MKSTVIRKAHTVKIWLLSDKFFKLTFLVFAFHRGLANKYLEFKTFRAGNNPLGDKKQLTKGQFNEKHDRVMVTPFNADHFIFF